MTQRVTHLRGLRRLVGPWLAMATLYMSGPATAAPSKPATVVPVAAPAAAPGDVRGRPAVARPAAARPVAPVVDPGPPPHAVLDTSKGPMSVPVPPEPGKADAKVGPARALPTTGPVAAGGAGSPAITVPPSAIASSLRVESVKVRLTVHRAGERLPDGTRTPYRGGMVDGEAEYTLTRPARPGERVILLNYTAAVPREPTELDEVAVSTYLDGPFQAARLELVDHSGAVTVRRVGPRGDLEIEPRPGATLLRLFYRVSVPHRYWPMGCSRGRCSLDGAIAPLPSVPAVGGPALPAGRVVDPVRWDVAELKFATAPTWSPGQVPSTSERRALRGDELVVTRTPVGGDGRLAYPSVFWGPRWHRSSQYYRGVKIEMLHMKRRPNNHVPNEYRAQLRRDLPGHVLRVARESLDVARAVGMEVPVGNDFMVVQGPVRTNVAEFHPSVVVVSDQALQLWPGRRFLQFHTAAIARASLDLLTYGRQVGRHDPSTDLWLHGALTLGMLDIWRIQREHGDEYVSDIFRRFTFVPVVDNFLYSGQATFAQAYFRGSDDIMPLRVHPLYFSHDLPTGRRIHEKLGDLMSVSQRAQLYIGLVSDPSADPRRLAELAYGRRLGWFFDQWLAPHPKLDYSVRAVQSAEVDGKIRNRITIGRDGDRPLIEPVQVHVRERRGKSHYLVWNGDADGKPTTKPGEIPTRASHTFTLMTDRPLQSVTVDPRARLLETALPPRANVDPLYNNRHPAQFRFIYSGVGFEVSPSEFSAAQTTSARLQAFSGRVLFEASRRRDLRYTGHLQFQRDREAAAAVGTGVSLWFGDKVNRRRRRARVRLFTELQYLNTRGLDQTGGVRVVESAAIMDDTRKFALWPDRGRRLLFGVATGQTLRFGDRPDRRLSLTLQASWVQIWHLAHQHTLASRLEMAIMSPLGTAPEYRSLIRVGGLEGLGGYVGNELFGQAMALAQLEYRHVYFNNLDVNLGHVMWLRGLGGALFTGVASVSSCGGYDDWFSRKSYRAQVGYGLMVFSQMLGVTPQFVRFDVAVPLIRRETICLGHVHPDYLGEIQGLAPGDYTLPPVGLNLTFLQPF